MLVGVNVAAQCLYVYNCFHLQEYPNFENCTRQGDKIARDLRELTLSLVFFGHGSTLPGLRLCFHALSA